MTHHKNKGMRLKGPYKVKKIMRHYGKQATVDIEIPYYNTSPDHRVLKHFGYSYLPSSQPAKPAANENSFLPE